MFGLDCSFPEASSLPFLQTGLTSPYPTSMLVLSLCAFQFPITVVLYPTYLCLLKCNSLFICNPTSPTKYPGFLHTSLLFFLQCPLVPAHGQLLWHLPHTAWTSLTGVCLVSALSP